MAESLYTKGLDLRDNSLTLNHLFKSILTLKCDSEMLGWGEWWLLGPWIGDKRWISSLTTPFIIAELMYWGWATLSNCKIDSGICFPCRIYGSSMCPRSPLSICLRSLQGKRTCEMHTHYFCCFLTCVYAVYVSLCECVWEHLYVCMTRGGHRVIFINDLPSPCLSKAKSLNEPGAC